MSKDEIRQRVLKERLDLSVETVQLLSQSIQDKLFKSLLWPTKGRVGLYSPVKNEVMTHSLFQKSLEKGLHVYFPRVEMGIQFYEVNGPEDLQKGSWSIPEPKKNCPLLASERNLDLLIVPGIVFTKDCCRIGYGRGFYDKYISSLTQKIPSVSIAYDFQLTDYFPIEEWDKPVDAVVTEKKIYMRDV